MDYKESNRKSWNNRTEVHFDSEFYDNESFIKGRNSLNSIELELLGDLSGKSVLHLQCHFGQDTISLNRMGAESTGVDLSDKAIEKAKELAQLTNSSASFICCDVYDLPDYLEEQFDVVFTSYGTIGWLPDMDRWAEIVSRFLKPGGKFILVEFHPVVWMFDDHFIEIGYSYFNTGPIIENPEGTYTDRDAAIDGVDVMWNHGIAEVINSLIKNNLEIISLDEFDYSPYDCFNGTIEIAPKKYRIEHLEDKLPMVYSVSAVKKAEPSKK